MVKSTGCYPRLPTCLRTRSRRVELIACPMILIFRNPKEDEQNRNIHMKTNPLVFEKETEKIQTLCLFMLGLHQDD